MIRDTSDPGDTVTTVPAVSPDFDMGEVIGRAYINEYFGLRMPFPEEWRIFSKAELAAYSNLTEEEYTNETVVMLTDNNRLPMVFYANNDNVEQPEMVTISGIRGISGRVPAGADPAAADAYFEELFGDQKDEFLSTELKTITIGGNDYYWPIYECPMNDQSLFYGVIVYGEGAHNLMISVMGPDRETVEARTHSLFE